MYLVVLACQSGAPFYDMVVMVLEEPELTVPHVRSRAFHIKKSPPLLSRCDLCLRAKARGGWEYRLQLRGGVGQGKSASRESEGFDGMP